MTWTLSIVLFVSLATLSVLLLHFRRAKVPSPPSMPRIESVQALSVLTVTKIKVADVIEAELSGHTGSVRVLLIVKGDVTCGVDLSEVCFTDVNSTQRTAVLLLTPPRTRTPRVDHEGTRIASTWTSGLWVIVPGGRNADRAVVNSALVQAQLIVAAAGEDADVQRQARQHAEEVLTKFFHALGWSITPRWAD